MGRSGGLDETVIVNSGLPAAWKCPHCRKRNRFGSCAKEIFMEHFKVIQQCGSCGNLHIWKLRLTDDFKVNVINMIREEIGDG